MKDSRYIIMGIILHVGWFLWGFYLWKYMGRVSFQVMYDSFNGETGGRDLAKRLNVFLVLYFIYSCVLWYFHSRYFRRSHTVRKKKYLYFYTIITATFLFATCFLLWWNYVPPMSEARALEYAKKKMANENNNLSFYSIKYNKNENSWHVIYNKNNRKDICVTLIIYRDHNMETMGYCNGL
ncbi:hypothetical protein [Paenibacillus sp. FSL H8-0537]|uniref:hypothetical protein n=1 Tax=Paenibacillus sp. FSL H8-0537 TaxID=2921399 RepID=UPI0031015CFD